ncbi:hypothetical protein Q2T76_06400 [Lactobacillus sp. YT155]|uniref:glycosyltransferase n=1 Tax=Lactobacillus sp. YT155 TaxID=3060955 RepID=UPI00265FCBD3|nr:nucleotide disphospho-sugar-binding domain-containing protein [Lactobacillus sp. YT155]MDO1605687.1 hypothetical protein [Lactobacillus sp. YT155]
MKKTIIFAPETFNLAETTRMIEIAKELDKDFDCQFFGFSNKYSKIISENGFSFELLQPVFSDEEINQIMLLDQMKGIKNPFTIQVVQQRVKNELNLIHKLQPSIVVTGSNPTIFLSARIAQIPLVYAKPYALSRAYYSEKKKNLIDVITTKIKWIPKAFKVTANSYNLQLPKYTIDLLEADYNFITTSSLFYDSKTLPKNYSHVGPIFAKMGEQLPDSVSSFIDQARKAGKKIIYFACGSSGNKKFISSVLKKLVNQQYYIIAPVASYLTEHELSTFKDNVLCTDWLPAHKVSPLVDFSIIHGGEGTVQTACESGKPFIGFGLQSEQRVNLSYCEHFGNAIQLKPSQVNSKAFDKAVKDIQSPSFITRAAELKEQFEVTGAKNAAILIRNIGTN